MIDYYVRRAVLRRRAVQPHHGHTMLSRHWSFLVTCAAPSREYW